jgi:hypothetical protein
MYDLPADLKSLENLLLEGLRRSMQGSYHRRKPAREAVPFLLRARAGLRDYVKKHGECAEAWRALSHAEECLLCYPVARECLERAIALSPSRDRRDLKRLAQLREYENEWVDLGLTPSQLEELGRHVERGLQADASPGRSVTAAASATARSWRTWWPRSATTSRGRL